MTTPMLRIRSGCCACAASGHAAAPPMSVMNSRRLVCRESSILRGDGGSVMTVSPPRREARRRFGTETASELGAPVASSIPEQLPGREPASTRKGYEDGNALFRWYRRVEGSFGHHGVARTWLTATPEARQAWRRGGCCRYKSRPRAPG